MSAADILLALLQHDLAPLALLVVSACTLAIAAAMRVFAWLEHRYMPDSEPDAVESMRRAELDLADRAHFPSFHSPWSP